MGITRLRVAAVTCGLVASAGLVTVVSSQAQAPGPPTGTLQLMQRERDARFRFLDVPPRRGERGRPNAGDGFIITGPVRDQAGQRAGRLQAVFVITNVRREQAEGTATFLLTGGRITLSGAETRADVEDFAITGGTGRYAGARGTMRLTEGRNTTGFLFTFMG